LHSPCRSAGNPHVPATGFCGKPCQRTARTPFPDDSAPPKLAVRWHRRRQGGRRPCRRLARPSRADQAPCRSLARPAATVTRSAGGSGSAALGSHGAVSSDGTIPAGVDLRLQSRLEDGAGWTASTSWRSRCWRAAPHMATASPRSPIATPQEALRAELQRLARQWQCADGLSLDPARSARVRRLSSATSRTR